MKDELALALASIAHELPRALAFYDQVRVRDPALRRANEAAIDLIHRETAYTPENVGSFGIGVNLPDSDLDLIIGVPTEDVPRVLGRLSRFMTYHGRRRSTPTSTREIFHGRVDGIAIDLGVLPPDDFTAVVAGARRWRDEMTRDEKALYVWMKKRLKESRAAREYATFKIMASRRYIPRFEWVPVL
jgi:hypothetical protein